jgi:hypothetical protein
LTSTLLGSVEKSRSGIAAGVLNATRQTGSVLGVALFGSLAGGGSFIAGAHASLVDFGRRAARRRDCDLAWPNKGRMINGRQSIQALRLPLLVPGACGTHHRLR